jgi:hypothetical protein
MREIFTINDGYGTQSFSTWDAARKYLFVLRGRFAGDAEDCGYQGALSFDTRNGAYEHGTPASAHRVKQVVSAGYQCTLRDSNDPHPTYITITPTQMWTAKDMDAQWRRTQQHLLDNAPRTVEEWEEQRS